MNKINNRFRYKITDRLGVRYVAPLGESDFTIKWTRQDDLKMSYKKELPNKFTLTGDPYNQILLLEKSEYRCEYLDIDVERYCTDTGAEVWKPWFTGRLSLNDGDWDEDRCTVEIKVSKVDIDQCFEDSKSTEINLLGFGFPRRSVRILPGDMIVEKKEFLFTTFDSFNPCTVPQWGDPGTPSDGRWVCYFHGYLKGPTFCVAVTRWARYAVTVDCADPSPGAEWLLVSTACPGVGKKYVKEANLYDCTDTTLPDHSVNHECKIVADGSGGVIDNGMELKDVLPAVINQICPGLTVVSDFFQINPVTPSDTNYVTGDDSKTNHLVLFQKSDVKRPDALNNATKATWTPEKFITALCEAFNCRWRIVGDEFQIEHVSFFTSADGFDLTTAAYAKYLIGSKKYSYQTEKIPSREDFKFMEASEGDFRGVPIYYFSACVSESGKENVTTHAVDDVTTDMELCFANASGESNVVDERGFVLVACREVGSDLLIITEPPILDLIPKLNNSLAWAQLHRDYHKFYRPLQFGLMNGENTEFESVRPTKKGATITIPLCCEDEFNPADKIKTLLGDGVVDAATFSFKGNTIELDLLYPVEDLVINHNPIAVNDTVSAVKNTPTEFDVLANDSDPDGDPIVEIIIFAAPTHGTATITPGLKILYTPALNYTGSDLIIYKIKDSYGNISSAALVSITVTVPALTLTLVNDFYSTDRDVVLNQIAAGGLLTNDSTTAGPLVCTAETKATTMGGTVQIYSNGAFDYTPPAGYSGLDYFTYTAGNGTDIDTANVEITVVYSGGSHLDLLNYFEDAGFVVGWCAYDTYRLCRTSDAVDAATAAGERVRVTVKFTTGTCTLYKDFIFEPTDTCTAPASFEVCNTAPGCSTIDATFISAVVIP